MNFLDICKRVRQDSGITGEGPASVLSQTGIMSRVVNWVKRANNELQEANDSWTFLRRAKSTALTATERTYTPEMLSVEPIKSITTLYLGGDKLEIVDYFDWLDDLQHYSASTTSKKPSHATLDDSGNVHFHPTPDKPYEVTIVYQRKPIQLNINADIPPFEDSFHEAIVCKALMFYADYEEDSYRYQRASIEYDRWQSLMANRYLPKITLSKGLYG